MFQRLLPPDGHRPPTTTPRPITPRTNRSPRHGCLTGRTARGRIGRWLNGIGLIGVSLVGALAPLGVVAPLDFAVPPRVEAAEPSDYLSRTGQHRLFSDAVPPGTLTAARALGRGPIAGYYQPVAFMGPGNVRFALPIGDAFGEPEAGLMAGLAIGNVYRFEITGIPDAADEPLYPTIEIIDRTYPPPGLATAFPIPIRLDEQDLRAARQGRMVIRVIYLEDPQTALPVAESPATPHTIDIPHHEDALETADRFGRPVAIVRLGSLAPPAHPALMPQFTFGSPPWAPIVSPETTASP